MIAKVEFEAKIEGLGEIYKVYAPFDKALEALKSRKAKIITSRDLAYARIQEGSRSDSSTYGSYVKEGDIYIPNQKGVILTRNSLVLKSPKQATQAHKKNKKFYIDKKQAMKYLEKAKHQKDNSAILLTDFNSIPTNRFGDDKLTVWLFQDQAKDYGLFLKENGINERPLHFNDQNYIKQKSPYADQLWLDYLGKWSYFAGDDRFLSYGDMVRGVLKKTGEASSRKSLPYTPKQIQKMYKIIDGVKEGKLPNSKLEKVLDFLEELKE